MKAVTATTGESWITTKFEKLEDWSQRFSFWPFPFGTACCAIEFMSTVSSHYDLARFGSEVVRFSPCCWWPAPSTTRWRRC
jgi:NADH-quinone oxidoreductase subunit B